MADRGESGARKGAWDLGMLRRAGEGGQMAQLVQSDSGRRTVSRRTRQAATGRTRKAPTRSVGRDGLGLGGIEGRGLIEE